MNPLIWQRLTQSPLTVDQTSIHLQFDREEIEKFYLPLAERMLAMTHNRPRLMTAVVGTPGSGKTVFATLLTAVINAETGTETAVCIGMDGWHFPNTYLDSTFIQCDDQTIPLRKVKGSPATFDTDSAYQCLMQIRQSGEAVFPRYSRVLHNPLPDAGRVTSAQPIIIAEGLYWLLNLPGWSRFHTLFDLTIQIEVDVETTRAALLDRHQRTGRTPELAQQQLKLDLQNAHTVKQYSAPADIIVQKSGIRQIASVRIDNPDLYR